MERTGGISEKSSRIAKNTALLYLRMFLLMAIGLYTSRVVLKALGVEGFGTWNAVAGIVAMFSVVSNSITSAISRYITFSLGKGDSEKLRRIFSTSLVIQFILCAVILILGETLGLWLLHTRMQIPEGSMTAAGWVLQCSMLIMMVNLVSVPYNADIIAHEHMRAFAYVSIVEAVLKLGAALLLAFSPADKLISYSVLMVAVAVIVRFLYSVYCRRHFEESRGKIVFEKALVKEMSGFAGWNFLGTTAYLFNTQGVNLLCNVFFGVGVNAARGVAVKVQGTIMQFVNNFTTALNPQITKSYAEGNRDYCNHLVCRGAKYTYLLLLFFALPLFFEAGILLRLWLGEVPEGAVLFTKLTVIAVMADMLGNSLAYLEMATGDIKRYYIIVGGISFLVFAASWVLFALGFPPEVSYYAFIAVYTALVGVKLAILKRQIGFPVGKFLREVILKAVLVTVPAGLLTWAVWSLVPGGWARLLATLAASTAAIAGFSYLFALTPGEKAFLLKGFKTLRNEPLP